MEFKRVIEDVFHWFAPGFADQTQQVASTQISTRRPACIFVDLLFDNRAIQIIRPKTQRNLCHRRCHHHPIGFDMRDVIQHQPRHRDLPYIVEFTLTGALTPAGAS